MGVRTVRRLVRRLPRLASRLRCGRRSPSAGPLRLDIEDEDELVGDIDIETFPTLLVGSSDRVLFFGAVVPTPDLLTRLLASLDGSDPPVSSPHAEALLQRLVSAKL